MSKGKLSFLIFGDVFGKIGRTTIIENVASLKRSFKPDLTIANIENMTHGSGFSATTVEMLMDAGIDFFTGGDHSLDNRVGKDLLKIPHIPIIRPENLPGAPGDGYRLITVNQKKILIINLLGRLFMKKSFLAEAWQNPFRVVDEILSKYSQTELHAILIDFHAETTSEKASFAYHVNGRVSVVYGTHTHIPTADERILNNGTGFITDVGFNGPLDSVIGINPKDAIYNFIHAQKIKSSVVESGRKMLNAIYVQIDPLTTTCTHIERIHKQYE